MWRLKTNTFLCTTKSGSISVHKKCLNKYKKSLIYLIYLIYTGWTQKKVYFSTREDQENVKLNVLKAIVHVVKIVVVKHDVLIVISKGIQNVLNTFKVSKDTRNLTSQVCKKTITFAFTVLLFSLCLEKVFNPNEKRLFMSQK